MVGSGLLTTTRCLCSFQYKFYGDEGKIVGMGVEALIAWVPSRYWYVFSFPLDLSGIDFDFGILRTPALLMACLALLIDTTLVVGIIG